MVTLMSPVTTTDAMEAYVAATEYDIDAAVIGTLYKPDECPLHLLEAMYANFGASPLWWDDNPEDAKRGIYRNFLLPPAEADNVTPLDGILARRGGIRALDLFSAAIGVAYDLDFTLTGGRRTGVDLTILPLADTRDVYVNTAGGQAYLTEAYRFLMPVRFAVRILFSAARDEAPIYIRSHFYERERIA